MKLRSIRGRTWNKFKKGRWAPKRKGGLFFELRNERTRIIRLMTQLYDNARLQLSLVDVTCLKLKSMGFFLGLLA